MLALIGIDEPPANPRAHVVVARHGRGVGAGKTVVVALGWGNHAILQPSQVGTFEEQLVNCDAAPAPHRRGRKRLQRDPTHGNGPQVGNLLIQNDWPPPSCRAHAHGRLRRREPGADRLHARAVPAQSLASPQARGARGDAAHRERRRRRRPRLRQPVQAGGTLLLGARPKS